MSALYAIIGDPIAQARSPALFNALYAARAVDAAMVALEVPASGLASLLDGLREVRNFGGAVITVPHKIAAAGLAAGVSDRVRIAGAANVLRPVPGGWEADLLDGIGFVAGLSQCGVAAEGLAAAVVGAGGAGLAIAAALLAAGAARVAIADRDADRARAAVARLGASHPGRVERRDPGPQDDLAVNATPCGMAPGDPLPFEVAGLRAGAVVADAIMKPAVTPLLEAAARRGLATCEGRLMLDGQAEAIWDFLRMGAAASAPEGLP
ncbi:shikimate dehydrogenase family protein [Labrys wisconsinensis]|uniref:Shikimate dehydrogenase n=1 Tax=Labrys wisconsinensis TaxID=425677 RepID=A0ABU0JKZ7_9HYPH|nr:shikimate dehydrogenase [Labrys wisconsinensis]MDQ0474136.1 shikimate dehydrogenase [Labrys wisconsinensis]